MDLQLTGKTAVVTGGSRGTGLAIVRTLLAEGMRVVTGSRRNTPELESTDVVHIAVDLSTDEGAVELIEEATRELGPIDLLVNNVGIGDTDDLIKGALQNLRTLPDSAWHQTFDLHFYSALRVTRAALPSLIDRRGVVVNVSSAGARVVTAGPAHYNVAKAALNALTKVVAEQFGELGVRAVTVSPGPIRTGVWTDPDGFIARVAKEQAVDHATFAKQLTASLGASSGRISTPEEVAHLVAFLASPTNITGSEHLIDGGIVKNV